MSEAERDLRRAHALTVVYDERRLVVHNFIEQRKFSCAPFVGLVLARSAAWRPRSEIVDELSQLGSRSAELLVDNLIEHAALISANTPQDQRDTEYKISWPWGPVAASWHFGTRNLPYIDDESERIYLSNLADSARRPADYFETNLHRNVVVSLQKRSASADMFEVMLRRRTERNLSGASINLGALADCLYFSLAITEIIELPYRGRVPFRPTPSGGAANSFEAFVLARQVDGLDSGVYHYSAMEHTLGLDCPELPAFPSVLGDQAWTANAAAVIVLVAYFERLAWRFTAPSTYNVLLMEAGHIGQNILLCAAAHGIASGPTSALNDDALRKALKLSVVDRSPMFALVLGTAEPGGDRHAITYQ